MTLAASLLCQNWQPVKAQLLPIIGVPTGAYLDQASPIALEALESGITRLEKAGYTVRRVPAWGDIKSVAEQTVRIMNAGAADSHVEWFAQYESLYGTRIAGSVRDGRTISTEQRQIDLAFQQAKRDEMQALMSDNQIDMWLTPSALGPAPHGIAATGDAAMNLPWTLIGFPTITLPTSKSPEKLPLGLQFSSIPMTDEYLLHWSEQLELVLQPIID
jgi:Asp-tRNA(Asn)/Glu-tRNA(Gln) amidotransferase A subunit family amidase